MASLFRTPALAEHARIVLSEFGYRPLVRNSSQGRWTADAAYIGGSSKGCYRFRPHAGADSTIGKPEGSGSALAQRV